MSKTEVNQCQNHENERLQEYDKDVEYRPDGSCNDMTDKKERTANAQGSVGTQHGNHQKQQFARVHVAPQPHGQ